MDQSINQYAVVLCGDRGYIQQIETTIKSICAHNKHIKFYLLNDNIPQEWFWYMNVRLNRLNCEIRDVKMDVDRVRLFTTPKDYINYATYFRYFIPLVVEESRAVYLDADMIVTDTLVPLFELDMQLYPIAAVPDIPTNSDEFNAGLLLIDVGYWREHHVTEALLQLTEQEHEQVFGDQGVLNLYFDNNWLALDWTYNLQVGVDNYLHLTGDLEWYHRFEGIPRVIHFVLEVKPWKEQRVTRFRELWWIYYTLDWEDIITGSKNMTLGFRQLVGAPNIKAGIWTNSAYLAHIETLLQDFPNVTFMVAAHVYFGYDLWKLRSYPNLELYPNFNPSTMERLLDEMDIYLDINYENEIMNIIETCKSRQIPIFGFDETSHDTSEYSTRVSVNELDQFKKLLIDYIERIA